MLPHTDAEFAAAADAVGRHVTGRYGVAIDVVDLPPPFKGDLDGARIVVAAASRPDERLFLLAHLFGHTVQWNVCARSRRLGMAMPVRPDGPMLDALEAYERDACRYSQQVIHEAGVTGFDQWLADHSACDLAYLRHFYATGERRPFREFWRSGRPLVVPAAIPAFTPRRYRRRNQAIVV